MGKRTTEEINQEYSEVCKLLGDLEVKYASQKSNLLNKVNELSQEMTLLEQSTEVQSED